MTTGRPGDRIRLEDLRPDLPDSQKWLMMVKHFLVTGAVGRGVIIELYRNHLNAKKRDGDIAQLQTALTEPADPLEPALARLRPHRADIVVNGKANKSAIARILKLPSGGESVWPLLGQLAAKLKAELEEEERQ